MTPLRAQMVKAMQMRGFSSRTHEAYLAAVRDLARFHHRSPAELSCDDVRAWLEYLVTERDLAPASVRLALNGARFLYVEVLRWEDFTVGTALPRRPERIPELLTRVEVGRILDACPKPNYRMMMTLCYGCGLRLCEVLGLKVSDIDGERRLLRVRQGKGAKDRLMPLSPTLIEALRGYWRLYRPGRWLFPGVRPEEALTPSALQRRYTQAKRAAGVGKPGGIHALRHAYATHQLEAGMPVHRLQRLVGHNSLQSTLRYIHWVPKLGEGDGEFDLLAKLGVDDG